VAPVKLVPVMVTISPDVANDGVNELMLGAGGKVFIATVTVAAGPEQPFTVAVTE
jgi:hypothetical protein